MSLELRPFDASQLDDWLAFFDGAAFADNPDWGTCYCRTFLFGGGGIEAWDRACARGENRAAMVAAIRKGGVDGLLARRDGEIVGWVHHGPTARFHTMLAPLEPADEGVASIVCFLVAAPHRGTGVARALLRASVEELRRRGFRAVDARPLSETTTEAMDQFTGPLGLYLSEGFEIVEKGEKRTRVRKILTVAP